VRVLPKRLTLFASETRIKQLEAMPVWPQQRGHAHASVSMAPIKSDAALN
jgi:hypothetical protein